MDKKMAIGAGVTAAIGAIIYFATRAEAAPSDNIEVSGLTIEPI